MPRKLEIRWMDAAELKARAAPYNPRRISDDEKAKLDASIRRFGFVLPVILNVTTNRIVGGHQRIDAAERTGTKVPVVEIETTEAKERILNIALNRIKGRFDAEKLDAVFRDLADTGADVESTGFDLLEIEELHAFLAQGGDAPHKDFEQVVVRVPKDGARTIREVLKRIKGEGKAAPTDENRNSNGNALAALADWYLAKNEP